MSFSTEVKQELVSLRIEKSCCMLSELNALTQSCASMTLHGRGQVSIAFSSENVTVAKRVFILLKKRLEINATPHFNKVERFGGRRVCVIRLSQGDTRKLMLSLHMLHESEQGEVYRGLPRRALTRKCCQHAFFARRFFRRGLRHRARARLSPGICMQQRAPRAGAVSAAYPVRIGLRHHAAPRRAHCVSQAQRADFHPAGAYGRYPRHDAL